MPGPTRSRCRDREHASDRRRRGQDHDVDRHCDPRRAPRPQSCPFSVATTARGLAYEVLTIVEIDADDRIVARVAFDADDIDAAFEELDARYLAGEAAAHAHTWSVIARTYAAFNRRELPATTPDWVNIDHRRGSVIRARRPDPRISVPRGISRRTSTIHIEAVHRLSDLGAVVTHAAHGISQEGFDAEWRVINVLTVEGDLINRCEALRRGRPRRRARQIRRAKRAGAAAGKRGKPSIRTLPGVLRGPRLGRAWRSDGRRHIRRRSPSRRERGSPTRSRCR